MLRGTDGLGSGNTGRAVYSFGPDGQGAFQWTILIADGGPDDDLATAMIEIDP